MPLRLTTVAPDFERRFAAFIDARSGVGSDVDADAAAIVADVRARGLAAVLELTGRFDRLDLTEETLAVSPREIAAAAAAVAPEDRAALELAAARIGAYHRRQMPADACWTDDAGAGLGWRWTPVDAAGLYVPGGQASYPSSVLMNAIPARVAGVGRLVICAPAPEGRINPLVLVAAQLAGVDTVYRIGGAQAIAAMAYGAGPIRPVDKITGPGNAWVAAAKRLVFGQVGIDMIAGPSEVVVIADASANPGWVALDLLAQAEHDGMAQPVLITPDAVLADAVAEAVEHVLATLPRRDIASASWRDHGAVIVTSSLAEAAALSDRIAPEHLELAVADPEALAAEVRHAGAIFLGHHAPEAVGDYVAGPNHVLPTSGTARFASGLSVLDFMKRTTLTRLGSGPLAAIGPAAARLADSEGLGAHARSVRCRLEEDGPA